MTRFLAAITLLAMLPVTSGCTAPGNENETDEHDGISFVAVPAIQFDGSEETGWWSQSGDAEWRIDDSLEPALALCLDETFTDVTVVFDVTLEQGEDASIVVSYDDGSYYFLGVGSFHNQYVVARQDRGSRARVLASYGLAQDIEQGTTIRLEASITYDDLMATLALAVDGRPVLECEDPVPLPGGQIGLRAYRTVASFTLLSGPE